MNAIDNRAEKDTYATRVCGHVHGDAINVAIDAAPVSTARSEVVSSPFLPGDNRFSFAAADETRSLALAVVLPMPCWAIGLRSGVARGVDAQFTAAAVDVGLLAAALRSGKTHTECSGHHANTRITIGSGGSIMNLRRCEGRNYLQVIPFMIGMLYFSQFFLATGSRQLRPNQPSLTVVSLSLCLNRLKVFNQKKL